MPGTKFRKRMDMAWTAFIVAVLLLGVVIMGPWGSCTSSREQALTAARIREMREVVLAIEAYQQRTGKLPASLDLLGEEDGLPTALDLSIYAYSPTGFGWMRDKKWVLAAPPDAANRRALVVGKLSGEISAFAATELANDGSSDSPRGEE